MVKKLLGDLLLLQRISQIHLHTLLLHSCSYSTFLKIIFIHQQPKLVVACNYAEI